MEDSGFVPLDEKEVQELIGRQLAVNYPTNSQESEIDQKIPKTAEQITKIFSGIIPIEFEAASKDRPRRTNSSAPPKTRKRGVTAKPFPNQMFRARN